MISEDFSTLTGIKAVASLLTGSDIIEFTGNDNQQFLEGKENLWIDSEMYTKHFILFLIF